MINRIIDKNSLPRFLFRGDSDEKNKRHLKATFNSGVLLTNLCNSGNGREIFSKPLEQLIKKHIDLGWDKTHFFSFSSDLDKAVFYGSNNKAYEEVWDYKETWDFAILTFDTKLLIQDSISEIGKGVFSARFTPTCREFSPTYKIILIDAYTHLKSIVDKSNIDLQVAIRKAYQDKEWLILSANPFGYNGELTGKFDTYCITEMKVFRYEIN